MPQTQTETSPFPRLPRPLNITVVGEVGLTEGVAVWLDEGRVDFLIRERLDSTRVQMVRLDLAGIGEQADLNVQLVRVVPGTETPYQKGWFHSGLWEPLAERDRDTVESFLDRSDVESGFSGVSEVSALQSQTVTQPPSVARSEPTPSREVGKSGASQTATGTSGSDSQELEAGGRAGVMRSMRRAQARMEQEREKAVKRAAWAAKNTRSQDKASKSPAERRDRQPTAPAAAPGVRRSATEGLRKGIPTRDIVMPVLSDVGGISLMATYALSQPLERSMNIGDSWFRVVLQRVPEVVSFQHLQLVLHLPDGSFVQAPAKILRLGPKRMLLESTDVAAQTIAVLRRLS